MFNGKEKALTPWPLGHGEDDGLIDAQRRGQRQAWDRLIGRVYEVNPLVCTNCGGEIRIISVILEEEKEAVQFSIGCTRGPEVAFRFPG